MNIKEFFVNFNNNFLEKESEKNETLLEIGKFAQGIAASLAEEGIYYWDDATNLLSNSDCMTIIHSKHKVTIRAIWDKNSIHKPLDGCKYIGDIDVHNSGQYVSLNNADKSFIAKQLEAIPFYQLESFIQKQIDRKNAFEYFSSYSENKSKKKKR